MRIFCGASGAERPTLKVATLPRSTVHRACMQLQGQMPDASLQGGPASTRLDAAACVHEHVVERMLAEGKLFVQQNMMAAQPDVSAMATRVLSRDKPVPECEQFGLRTILSREGNFVAIWFGDVKHALSRSFDSDGMLTPFGHKCPGVSTTRKKSNIQEEAKALCAGWGEGERSEIRGTTTKQEGNSQEEDVQRDVFVTDEEVGERKGS